MKPSNKQNKTSQKREESLKKRFPPLIGVELSKPCVIVDAHGIILTWYLPRILMDSRQVGTTFLSNYNGESDTCQSKILAATQKLHPMLKSSGSIPKESKGNVPIPKKRKRKMPIPEVPEDKMPITEVLEDKMPIPKFPEDKMPIPKVPDGRTTWRTNPEAFHPGQQIPSGCINISPAWFQQAHEVSAPACRPFNLSGAHFQPEDGPRMPTGRCTFQVSSYLRVARSLVGIKFGSQCDPRGHPSGPLRRWSGDIQLLEKRSEDRAPGCHRQMDFCIQWRFCHHQQKHAGTPGRLFGASLVRPSGHPRQIHQMQFGTSGCRGHSGVRPWHSSWVVGHDAGAFCAQL